MSGFLHLWPAEASAYSGQVDMLVLAFTALIICLSAPVFILIVVFAVKYRRGKPADRSHPVNQRMGWEVSWALIPFLLIIFFYVWSTRLFFDAHEMKPGALGIDVVAKQWMWKFQHPGGQREINELHVPAGALVKLNMASQDVIHSLFVPALRIKQDVLPGRYTTLQFTADKPGHYRLACAEFCGTDHARMGGSVIVMKPAGYTRWLEESEVDQSLARQGRQLFMARGCSGCHGPAARVHAPDLVGLFGSEVPLENGDIVTADEQYVRDSILLPQSQIAAGYPHIMPTFQNLLSEDEVLQLIAYIKSLRNASGQEETP